MHCISHASESHATSLQLCLVQVTGNAREVWDKDESKSALRKRVSFVGGDFFKKGARLAEALACGCLHLPVMHAREPEHHKRFVVLLHGLLTVMSDRGTCCCGP